MIVRCSTILLLLFAVTYNQAEAQSFGGVDQLGRGGMGSPGMTGSRSPGVAGLRSGLGISNNPIANPSPSMTPYVVMNPQGSLRAAELVNANPLLWQPNWGDYLSQRSAYLMRYEVVSENRQRIYRMSRYDGARSLIGNARGLAGQTAGLPLASVLPLEEVRALGELLVRDPYTDVKDRLPALRKRFDEIAATPEYSELAQLATFQSIHLLLKEFELPLAERAWKVLAGLHAELQQTIDGYQNAEQWKSFLAMPDVEDAAEKKPSREALLALKKRFDKVAAMDKYTALTGTSIFGQTLDQLVVVIEFAEPTEDDESVTPAKSNDS